MFPCTLRAANREAFAARSLTANRPYVRSTFRGPRTGFLMGALPPSPLAGFVLALAATPLMHANDAGSAAGRLWAGPLGWGGGRCRRAQRLPSPAHGGRRATGCAREAVKVNAMIYAFTRPERRRRQGKTAAPAGAPCEAPGSAACGQRHFSGYSFGAKRVPLRSSSYSRRKARCYLSKMKPVRTSGTLLLCP